jgi:serine/threonine-protein kinase
MIGSTIGKYRIIGQLGRGGSGIVYRAVDETLNRDVAIKTLNPDLADTDILKRFRAEATILAKLHHPQIATIYELFRADTDLLMVMEYVAGETLEKLSDRLGPMPPTHAAYLVDQVLSALEHAHRAGVVHRDMKPANVMVTEEGSVKIMDFGIARVRGAEQVTVDGRMMGTPAYMPPEQVLGQEVDGRADLYSVGVVFYRLLTGALPFTADTPIGMLQRQILEAPLPLDAHRSGLPEWCDGIVRRALAKSPAERFQTAEEFREALSRAAGLLTAPDLKPIPGSANDSVANAPATDTILMSRPDVHLPAPPARFTWAHAALAVLGPTAVVLGYLAFRPVNAVPPAPAATAPAVAPVPEAKMPAAPREPVVAPPDPAPAKPAVERVAARPVARPPVTRRPAPKPPEEAGPPGGPVASPPYAAAPLLFEAKALVGSKGKYKERDAQLALADGHITVTTDDEQRDQLYSIPFGSVLSITYSRGRDPLWNSPQGPAPVARAGGTLGRMGIFVGREWIALRTSTNHQFVALRFDDVLVKRVLVALEERTGRAPQFIAERKDGK